MIKYKTFDDYIDTHTKLNKRTGCIIWTGPIDKEWQRAKVPPHIQKRFGLVSCNANRAIFAYYHPKRFKPDKLVCHGPCNDGTCVNTKHMHLGTTKTNAQERSAYGHQRKGNDVHNSMFNRKQVLEIRRLAALGLRTCEIKKLLSLNSTWAAIKLVIQRKNWKHI